MASHFPKLFRLYYSIHETIHAILSEHGAIGWDTDEVARRVRQQHPNLDMPPDTLAAAIQQAKADNPYAARL